MGWGACMNALENKACVPEKSCVKMDIEFGREGKRVWGMCMRRKKKHGKELRSEMRGTDGLYGCEEERSCGGEGSTAYRSLGFTAC